MSEFSFARHSENKEPVVKSIYDRILKESRELGAPIRQTRTAKSEQVSASRFHQEVKLTSPDEVDSVPVGWLKAAYGIGS